MEYRPQLWTLRVYETLMKDFAVRKILRKYGELLEVHTRCGYTIIIERHCGCTELPPPDIVRPAHAKAAR